MKLGLPVLRRVRLRAFSLYTERPRLDLDIPDGVFCIVGANGLGKSTFISAVNFGLCGRIPKPGERFQSADEYFHDIRDFSSSFFEGRITEADRHEARVELEFTIREDHYHIIRGAFEPDQLQYASLNGERITGNSTAVNDLYKSSVKKSVGVSTFEQFVFLQFFIFTFDERRNLTFWETPVQRQMLLLAFGDDAGEAQEAEDLRRSTERLESIARNANYQATETRKRLQRALQVLNGLSPEVIDLREEQETLDQHLDQLCARESDTLATLSDSKLRSAELRSQALSLKGRIDEVFTKRAARTSNLRVRPIVADSLASCSCHLCGASGAAVIRGLEKRISKDSCPLCGIDFPTKDIAKEAIQTIVQLDTDLSSMNQRIQDEVTKQHRTEVEIDNLHAAIAQQQSKIGSFERQHRELSKSIGTTDVKEIELSIQANQRVIRDLNARKIDVRRQRDNQMRRLKDIQGRISQLYAESENEFLGIFRDLAESFIGLDLDARFDVRGTQMHLILAIDGQTRRQHYQLSESQRFFVDIALRMAIVHFISCDDKGSLLIDTPEGSLDIAYESRAGEMFARFVESGYQLLMTANINTSRLLRELAKRCGSNQMHLERMTEWTTLSAVQETAQDLFREAFDQIEADLTDTAG